MCAMCSLEPSIHTPLHRSSSNKRVLFSRPSQRPFLATKNFYLDSSSYVPNVEAFQFNSTPVHLFDLPRTSLGTGRRDEEKQRQEDQGKQCRGCPCSRVSLRYRKRSEHEKKDAGEQELSGAHDADPPCETFSTTLFKVRRDQVHHCVNDTNA